MNEKITYIIKYIHLASIVPTKTKQKQNKMNLNSLIMQNNIFNGLLSDGTDFVARQ